MPPSAIRISVVVPSLNQGHFIDEALSSLLSQEYPALEIIVMDGGSTDATLERLRHYGDRIVWTSAKDGGQSDAIAKGFERATGEWLTWLNADDLQCDRALWLINDVVQHVAGVDVVVGRGHYMDASGDNPRAYPTIQTGDGADVKEEIFRKGYMAQPSVYFRREAYAAIGGINPALRFCMDYELWARFALHGCRFAACSGDISGNRWYASTKTASQTLELLAEVVSTQVRLFGRVSPYFVQAVSDNLYSVLHSSQFGDGLHVVYRLLYFKTIWLWFNLRRPWYCLKGLLFETIAISGPVVGDKLTWRQLLHGIALLSIRKESAQ